MNFQKPNMDNIQMISTSTVQATTDPELAQKKRINLSSNDLRFLLVGAIQRGFLFRKPKPSEAKIFDENLIQHLRNSLSRTLSFFFPLAGRLGTVLQDDNTTQFFIDCNSGGVEFVHAVAENVTVSDILEPTCFPPIFHSFFPLSGIKNHEGVVKPLFAVQVTEIADGIFIGCAVNHSVMDGSSFWHFIKSWSEICCGSDQISQLPVFDNWFRGERYCPSVSLMRSMVQNSDVGYLAPLSPLEEKVFHFNKENIAKLKTRANLEAGIDKISSLQALLAHVWRSVNRCQQLDPEQATILFLPIGLRSRLHPEIPQQYFGNAILGGNVTIKRRVLLESGLGHAALQIHQMVAGYTNDEIKKSIESWINNPCPTLQSYKTRNMLVVRGSTRFDVYGNDFGWGRPIAAPCGPADKSDGVIIVGQGLQEGSIDIEVCNLPEVLQAMRNDSEFMDAVMA